MIQDLNNEEISEAYYLIRDYLYDIDEVLKSGFRTKRLELDLESDSGEMRVHPIVMFRITEDEINGIRSSHHYATCKSIIAKLKPIVELIEEAQPEIKLKYDNNE